MQIDKGIQFVRATLKMDEDKEEYTSFSFNQPSKTAEYLLEVFITPQLGSSLESSIYYHEMSSSSAFRLIGALRGRKQIYFRNWSSLKEPFEKEKLNGTKNDTTSPQNLAEYREEGLQAPFDFELAFGDEEDGKYDLLYFPVEQGLHDCNYISSASRDALSAWLSGYTPKALRSKYFQRLGNYENLSETNFRETA